MISPRAVVQPIRRFIDEGIALAGTSLLVLAMLSMSCSSKPEEPSTADASSMGGASNEDTEDAFSVTAPPLHLAEPALFYRLDILEGQSGLELIEISLQEQIHVQPPSFAPSFMAVGYKDGDVIAVAPFGFSHVSRSTSRTDGASVHTEIAISNSATTVYLEASAHIDTLDILSPGEQVELTLSSNELPATETQRSPQSTRIDSKYQAISDEQLAFRYAHIRFLGQGDETKLAPNLLGTATLVDPTEAMNDVLANGLAHVAPGLLGSVSHIGLARWPSGSDNATSTLGMALGAQLILNADLFGDADLMSATVVHEIAHNFTFLCNTAGETTPDFSLTDWPTAVGDAASALMVKHQLLAGLSEAFRTLHESGESAEVATSHTGSEWPKLSLDEARSGGFASPYGSTNELEDLAEYVGTTQLPTPSCPGICPTFVWRFIHRRNERHPLCKAGLFAFHWSDWHLRISELRG